MSSLRPQVEDMKGDLLTLFENNTVNHMVHGCNCIGIMGAGLARQVAHRYPDCYEQYKELCSKHQNNPSYLLGHTFDFHPKYNRLFKSDPNQSVINAFTQINTGVEDSYVLHAAIKMCFIRIFNSNSHCSIGVPEIGCGIAGGDWKVVRKIIQDTYIEVGNYSIKLIFVQYDK